MRTSLMVGFVAAAALLASAGSAQAALSLPTMQCSYSFNSNLSLGTRSASVMDLQKVLNMYSQTKVASTGAGSPGMETSYFGPATKAAVVKFQALNSVTPTSGLVGPLTRAVLNQVCTGTTVPPTTGTLPAGCTSTVGYSPTTGLSCSSGTTSQSGPVTATLATTNPASGVIVAGQATANLAEFTFSGNGVVNSVMLKRSGISDQNTLSNVYLYDGVNRLTDGYSFNNNGDITMNNLGLMVSGSKTISVKADVAGTSPSGQTIAVWLTGFTAGTSVNTTSISGNLMSVASGSTLASAVMKCNTLTGAGGSTTAGACNPGAAISVNAGTSSYRVWTAPIQVNTRTLVLKAANFRISGSAPSDTLANVQLFVDGVKVGNNATMTSSNGSNYLTFDLSSMPATLTTGSHTLEVRGDVVKGSSFNFTVSLRQASDLMIMDPQVGVNLALTSEVYGSFSANTAAQINVGAGSATIVIDPTFNTMTNVTGGASNTAIAKFKIRGYGEDVKVTSLSVTPVFTGATTPVQAADPALGLQNVTLYFNGSQVGSQQLWTTGPLSFNLGSQMVIPANVDSILEVRADLRNKAGSNYTAGIVSANITGSSAEGWNSKSSVTLGTANGNQLTMQTGLLALAKNTGYANLQTQNPNTSGVKISSYVLQNQSSSEGVRVTGFTVNPIGAGTSALTNLSGLRTSETSGNGAIPQQPASSNSFTVDFILAPGATKVIDIFADTSSATGVTVIPTLAVSALGQSSNTDASQVALAGQTITLSAGTLATPTLLTASSTTAQFVAAGDPMLTGTGATDATKASFTFVSTGGSSTISELKFNVNLAPGGVGTATNPVMSVKVGNVTAPVVAGVAWLQGLNLSVPNGGSGLSVDALITYAPVGTSGVTPNTTVITALTYVKYTSGGTTLALTPTVNAPTITVVGSKPTVTVSSTTASGLNISGVGKIGEVTISADAKGNVKLNTLVFTISSSGFSTAPTAVAGTVISDSNSSSTPIAGATCTPASLVVTCTLDTNANPATGFDGYTITAGTSKTFSLFGSLTGAAATGSGTPTITSSLGASTFNWDDTSTNGATGINLNGSLLYGFPNSSFSIRQ